MITRRTKIQLMIFVLITMLGVSFVGAKYAQLDRLILDDSYTVTAHFADSGGIFSGAEVTYRGVTVGRVGTMELSEQGVDVNLDIENGNDDIPADARAVVANRSAVGEQYVDLQPQSNGQPYLEDGSEIDQSDTAIPITTSKWLLETDQLVKSVDRDDLRTVVREFGAAFKDGGQDLTRLIETQSSFINAAQDNFGITTKLIREGNVVLDTQLDKASAIRSFARDLALFTGTLANSDPDLRRVIENGSATATQLRTFLEDNDVDLARLIDNLITTGEVQIKHLAGTRMILILYPYVVAGGFVVNSKTNGVYNAHFGLITTSEPHVCNRGYNAKWRDPNKQRGNAPMDLDARCTEPQGTSNPRGAQHAPQRVAPWSEPTVATYDQETGRLRYGDDTRSGATVSYTGGAQAVLGKESWKWLLLHPVMPEQ